MKMKLLTEVSQNVKVQSSDDDHIFVEGIFSSAENKNINGRIYKKATLEREVDKLMEKVANKCLWGELSHPQCPEVSPDKTIAGGAIGGGWGAGAGAIIGNQIGNAGAGTAVGAGFGVVAGIGPINAPNGHAHLQALGHSHSLVSRPNNGHCAARKS